MTDRLTALRELLAKVENVEDFWSFGRWDLLDIRLFDFGGRAFNGSLDAALALHEAVLPGWTVNSLHQLRQPDNGMPPTGQWTCLLFRYSPTIEHVETKADTPARAWLIAILRALIAQEEGR